MKKIIAISVMLVLIAGAVFADVTFGGQFKAGATLLLGNTIEKSDVQAGKRYPQNGTEGILNANFGDANLGGMARFFSRTSGDYFSPNAFAFAWWKPTESFRIQMGNNPDKNWGAAKITGWGFQGEAQDFVAIDADSGEWRQYGDSPDPFAQAAGKNSHSVWMFGQRAWGFYGGFGNNGHDVALSFYPSEALTVNIGVPFSGDWKTVKNQYLSSHLNIVYNLEGTGTISVTYEGQGTKKDGDDELVESPKVWGSFYLSAIEGIGVDIGVGFQPKLADKATTPPILVGLGFTYRSEDFGVKLRLGAALAGKSTVGGKEVEDPMMISVGVLPYYNLGVCTAYLNAGLGMVMPKEGDAVTGWFFNPYVMKSVEGAKLFAGVKVYSNGLTSATGLSLGDKANPDNKIISWGVPIGVNIYF
jgi:hypothetical protein